MEVQEPHLEISYPGERRQIDSMGLKGQKHD